MSCGVTLKPDSDSDGAGVGVPKKKFCGVGIGMKIFSESKSELNQKILHGRIAQKRVYVKGEQADFCTSEVQKYEEVQRSMKNYQEGQ